MDVLFPLLLAFGGIPLVLLVGKRRPERAGAVAAIVAGLVFLSVIRAFGGEAGRIGVPWVPSWNLELSLGFDGLGALYALVTSGIGFLVFLYALGYLPDHLRKQERRSSDSVPFFAFLLLFEGSMLGLVLAGDLFLLFVFWELTTIASYFLIAFDRREAQARRAALTALLVTGGTSMLFLAGLLLLHAEYQTASIAALLERARPGPITAWSGALILAACLAKSAQFPFQFWLPRAMVAPVPVSAYLHAAAMVAAGVFLLSRLHPLFQLEGFLLDLLRLFGYVSILFGSLSALLEDHLKKILAHSTIAQYGFIAFLLGLGGREAVAAASFYVLAHATVKCALFMAAGAVSEATGKDTLGELGGLGRSRPLLALGTGVAAAGLAGLPLTVGFFKDELLFKLAAEAGAGWAAAGVLAPALTLAYTWRFWGSTFLGAGRGSSHRPSPWLTAPLLVLAAVAIAGGVAAGPFGNLAEQAGEAVTGAPVSFELSYGLKKETGLAALAYALGVLFILARRAARPALQWFELARQRAGSQVAYRLVLGALQRASVRTYRWISPELGDRVAAVLVPAVVLVAAALIVLPAGPTFEVGEVRREELPLLTALLIASIMGPVVAFSRKHLAQLLSLSGLQYALAAAFAFFGAPDVALVAVLVATLSGFFFVGFLAELPVEELERAARPSGAARRWRELLVAAAAGASSFFVAWGALTESPGGERVGRHLLELAPAAHAHDAVTAVVADFRGLDTLGEITVIGIALVGISALLRMRERR